MTGTKGHSGGARPGSGPKAKMLRIGRQFSIKAGQQILVHFFCPDGIEAGQLAIVRLEGHGRNRQIAYEFADGMRVVAELYS